MATKQTTLHPETEPAGKLIILTIVTLGLYYHFWCFKHWSHLKEIQGRNIWPAGRGLLGPLLAPWLYRDLYTLDDRAKAGQGVANGVVTVISVVVLNALSFIPASLTGDLVIEVIYTLLTVALIAIVLVGMVLAQQPVNRYWSRSRTRKPLPIPGKTLFIIVLMAMYLAILIIAVGASAPVEGY